MRYFPYGAVPRLLGEMATRRLDVNPRKWFSKWLKHHMQKALENEFRMPCRVVLVYVTGCDIFVKHFVPHAVKKKP